MAQLFKLLTTKTLLIPFTLVGAATVGSAYVSYSLSRSVSAAILGVDTNNQTTACQIGSFGVGGLGLGSYLTYRHYKYPPPTFSEVLVQMQNTVKPTPPTNAAGLPLDGPLSRLPANVIRSPPKAAQPSRFALAISAVNVPIRFYMGNMLIGAAVLGVSTSIGQRLICGKPEQTSTIDKAHS